MASEITKDRKIVSHIKSNPVYTEIRDELNLNAKLLNVKAGMYIGIVKRARRDRERED